MKGDKWVVLAVIVSILSVVLAASLDHYWKHQENMAAHSCITWSVK